jgi:uncharacterized protein YecE (DUF72 family)
VSWTYPDWIGTFYPPSAKNSEFLSLYSRVFDIVEVDSTFYRSPSPILVKQWREKTPDNFIFSVKMPRKITHELKLQGAKEELKYFESSLSGLESKLGSVIMQLPPFLKFEERNLSKLREFLDTTDSNIRYAVEFRNTSWFREETYGLLNSKNVSFVWSINEYVEGMPNEVTSDFVYLRFMGDFGELKKLNKIQIDRSVLLRTWSEELKAALPRVKRAYVLVSNHFAGFAPETVNHFRELCGLAQLDLKANVGTAESLG